MEVEITKREIMFSVIIVAVMLLIGFVIHGKISDNLMDDYQKYDTALQIDNDEELFKYGMRTNIGYAFVYGDLEAVDTVSYPEINGEYSYIEKVKEKYTMHTRTVTKTDSKGEKHTVTETYWTWDRVGSESRHCDNIYFVGVQFKYGTIDFPLTEYIDTQKVSSHVRYKYYGCKTKYTGTLFANLKDQTISNVNFFNNMDIEHAINSLESGGELIIFWIVWIILTAMIVFGFYYIDNQWLE